jgi:hypothetical protein
MKNIISLAFVLLTLYSFSQKIKVTAVKYQFQSGQKFALSVNIHSDNRKDITKAFKQEADSEKGTILEHKGELFMDNAIITEVSASKIDIYATIDRHKDGTADLIVCFEVNNEYIIPKSKEYNSAVKFMENLAKKISIVVLEKEVEKEEKSLKKIKNKLVSLENKNTDLEANSSKRKSAIEKGKIELKTASEELKIVTKNINEAKGKLDKLAKEKENLDTKYEKLTRNITKNEQTITSNIKKIEVNKKTIEGLEKDKTNQKNEVDKAKSKLADVR